MAVLRGLQRRAEVAMSLPVCRRLIPPPAGGSSQPLHLAANSPVWGMLGALTRVDYSWKAGIARPSPVTLTSPHTLVRLRGLLDLTRQARDLSDLADVLEAVSQVI